MFEFINAQIACVIITVIMIAIVEHKIRLRMREIEEWREMHEHYSPEDKE